MANVVEVVVYVADHCWLGSVHLMQELLAVAGTLQRGSAELRAPAMFRVTLAGVTAAQVTSFAGSPVQPSCTLDDAPAAGVVIVPSFYLDQAGRPPMPAALRRWLLARQQAGAIFVGLTSGVRVLAEAGVLDGRRVAVNPADRTAMRNHYPALQLDFDSPLVIDGRAVTAASINPAIDACAYLTEHFFGARCAAKFARYCNSVRQPSYEQAVLTMAAWQGHSDERIRQAQTYIERQFRQDLSVGEIARHVAMSERTFARRFQSAVGMSTVRYLARCRIEHARQLLETTRLPVLTVAMQCGYGDENAFRRAFRQVCGVAPSVWRHAAA